MHARLRPCGVVHRNVQILSAPRPHLVPPKPTSEFGRQRRSAAHTLSGTGRYRRTSSERVVRAEDTAITLAHDPVVRAGAAAPVVTNMSALFGPATDSSRIA